ncbi:Translation initiation factor IF-2, partial [Pseudomonas amygdali pv. lachrymans]
MTQVTVKELAKVVDTPVERLLQQMREAGLPHTAAEQVVTDNEKQALLTHLKSGHKAKVEEPRKITLQRKTTSTLRVAGSKSISVEVRKKKVFVQRSPEEIEAERKREMDERRAVENAARQKAEEEAKRRAEEDARNQPAAGQPASAPEQPVAAAEPVREAPAPAAAAPAPASAAPSADARKRDEQRRPDKPR